MGNFVQNSAWLGASNAISNVLLFLFNFLIIKLYGPASHGQFAFALSLLLLLRLFFDVGLCNYLTKAVSKRPETLRYTLFQVSVRILFMGIPAIVIWLSIPLWFPRFAAPSHLFFLMWFAGHFLVSVVVHTFVGLGLGFQAFLTQLIYGFSMISGVVLLGIGDWPFERFLAGVNVFVMAGGLVSLFLLLPHLGRRDKFPFGKKSKKGILSESLMLWLPGITITLFPQVMTILVDFGYSDALVSVFSTLLAWSAVSIILLGPAGHTLFAWTASLESEYREKDLHSVKLYYRVLGFTILFFALLLLALSPAVRLIYGPAYFAYPGVFVILIAAHAADFPRFLTTPLLSGGAHASLATRIEALKFFFIIVTGGWIAFRGYPLWGLALAVLTVQFLFSLIRLFHVKRILKGNFLLFYIRILAITGIGCVVVLLELSLVIKCVILAGLFLASGIRRGDFRIFLEHGRKTADSYR